MRFSTSKQLHINTIAHLGVQILPKDFRHRRPSVWQMSNITTSITTSESYSLLLWVSSSSGSPRFSILHVLLVDVYLVWRARFKISLPSQSHPAVVSNHQCSHHNWGGVTRNRVFSWRPFCPHGQYLYLSGTVLWIKEVKPRLHKPVRAITAWLRSKITQKLARRSRPRARALAIER